MQTYKVPLREFRYVLHEVLDVEAHYRSLGRDDVNAELIEGVLEGAARFAEDVVAPTNEAGDRIASHSEMMLESRSRAIGRDLRRRVMGCRDRSCVVPHRCASLAGPPFSPLYGQESLRIKDQTAKWPDFT